jgi:hypothetical protein
MGFPEGTTVLRGHHYDNVIVARATIRGIAVLAGITFLGIGISIAAAQAAPARTVATALALLELAIGIGSAIGAQLLATGSAPESADACRRPSP